MNKILFSKQLHEQRKKCGYDTINDLARKYNETFPSERKNRKAENSGDYSGILGTLKNYENPNKKCNPRLDIVDNLCKLLSCNVDYLLGNIGCKTHDVQFIHDYTGLSEKAIEKLRATKALHDCILPNPYLPYINTLFEQLEPSRYSDVVHEIAAYLRSDGLSKNMWYNVENRNMEYKEYNRGKDFNLPIPAGSDMFDNLLLMDIQEKLKTLKKQIKNKQTPDTN